MSEERIATVNYLRSLLLSHPDGEAEEHVNDVILAIITDIKLGLHRVHARGEL